ncbi:TatD DNase family protein [Friedmanniella endophytica]|uniref:TatD DNase family protein n=1 Tax=Microlunatus kandeliicorticis TaxID=1759536 RepID=A0A7W3P620_9ACTN|nr:TatD family hydrolase [Microlunatus kandeliicorticis]MBA8794596.1 TatD DNase family protein [Microlunatus kandeliicorticis]
MSTAQPPAPRERRAGTDETGRRRNLERPARPEPLPAPVADSHCHLDVADGRTDLDPAAAVAAAASVGVTRIVQVGCDVAGSRWAVEAARTWPSVVAAVAVHPNDAARLAENGPDALEEALAAIDALAGDPVVRAVGETGLDYFRTREDDGRRTQRESFARHLAIARTHGRTVVVHDRDAHDDVLAVVDAEGVPERWVMHCFSGDADVARACLDRGAYLSFAGTVTFKNAGALREALRITPLDRVLTETDAPYLTPEPYRGRPNASYLIPHTARVIAETLGTDLAEVCRALDANTSAAFGGPWPSAG